MSDEPVTITKRSTISIGLALLLGFGLTSAAVGALSAIMADRIGAAVDITAATQKAEHAAEKAEINRRSIELLRGDLGDIKTSLGRIEGAVGARDEGRHGN